MQGITTLRGQLSNYTKVPPEKLVFEVGDVGGGFGQRSGAYPEYAALMIAAKALGAPVKWVVAGARKASSPTRTAAT